MNKIVFTGVFFVNYGLTLIITSEIKLKISENVVQMFWLKTFVKRSQIHPGYLESRHVIRVRRALSLDRFEFAIKKKG